MTCPRCVIAAHEKAFRRQAVEVLVRIVLGVLLVALIVTGVGLLGPSV